jgi:hypothetical protein
MKQNQITPTTAQNLMQGPINPATDLRPIDWTPDYQAIENLMRTMSTSDCWQAAKNLILFTDDEKSIKNLYKKITGKSWKKYEDSSDLTVIDE